MTTKKIRPTTTNPRDDPDYILELTYYGDYTHRNFITDFFLRHLEFAGEHLNFVGTVYKVACFVAFFINLMHLFVLTRKELRSNIVYIVMIGICISDIVQSFGTIMNEILTWNILYEIENPYCQHPYLHVLAEKILKTLQYMSRRSTGILGLFIAVIRTISVIFPMSGFVHTVSKPRFGYLAIFITLIACTLWSLGYFVQAKVVKNSSFCFYGKPTTYENYYLDGGTNEIIFKIIDGYIGICVSILYILVTIFLVVELQKTKRRRKNLRNDKPNNTSSFVIAMAISTFSSEFAYGLVFTIEHFIFGFEMFQTLKTLFMHLNSITLLFLMASSFSHIFICFFMSSLYRDTVKRLVWTEKEKKGKTKIFVMETTSTRPATVDSSKTNGSSKRTF